MSRLAVALFVIACCFVASLSAAEPCPAGWKFNATNNHCYNLEATASPVTWVQAKAACAAYNARTKLVTLGDQTENDYVYNYVKTEKAYSGNIWIGLEANDAYPVSGNETCSNAVIVPVLGRKFSGTIGTGTGTVDPYGDCDMPGKENFFRITPAVSGTWTFKVYSAFDAVIDLYSGACTSYIDCEDYNGANATDTMTYSLTAGQTYTVVVDKYRTTDSGTYTLEIMAPTDNGKRAYSWIDDTNNGYTNWDSGEPSNSAGNEACGELKIGTTTYGKWNDLPCNSTTALHAYVCEYISSICGDNVVEGIEECDDGNLTDNDGCDANCRPTGCGNGRVTGTEQCDDGNVIDLDACNNDCTYPCPAGWNYNTATGKCYDLLGVGATKTWTEADAACETAYGNGTTLATIGDSTENAFLFNYVKNTEAYNGNVWIGLEGEYAYPAFGNEVCSAAWITPTMGRKYSGYIGTGTGTVDPSGWCDMPGKENFFTFTAGATGEWTFRVYSQFDAVVHIYSGGNCGSYLDCEDYYGGNATDTLYYDLTAGQTYTVVVDKYSTSDAGTYTLEIIAPRNYETRAFSWIDDTNSSYLNWDSGEPTGVTESCAEMKIATTTNAKWNDLACNNSSVKLAYTCETPGNILAMTNKTAITTLDLSNRGLTSLEGIEAFTGLLTLNASYNNLSDVSYLAENIAVTTLNISHNPIVDVDALLQLPNLQQVTISHSSDQNDVRVISIDPGESIIYFVNRIAGIIGVPIPLNTYTELSSLLVHYKFGSSYNAHYTRNHAANHQNQYWGYSPSDLRSAMFSSWPFGVATQFDGNDQVILYNYPNDYLPENMLYMDKLVVLGISGAFTVSTWVKPTDSQGEIISHCLDENCDQKNFSISYDSNSDPIHPRLLLTPWIGGSSYVILDSIASIYPGWVHFAYTVSAVVGSNGTWTGSADIYINGVKVKSGLIIMPNGTASLKYFTLGRESAGYFDEFRIHHTALADRDILDLYYYKTCPNGTNHVGENGECQSVCGDGVQAPDEECDDDNTVTEACAYGLLSCSVCDATCHTVPGETSYCGDETIDAANGENCDDSVNDGTYGHCKAGCKTGMAAYCGDGTVNGSEVCDDGVNDGSYNGCMAGCAAIGPHCGDGVVQANETCDGNNLNNKTCATQVTGATGGTLSCNGGCSAFVTTACTKTYTCADKPTTGTVWNSVSSYLQTWDGSAWVPADDTTTDYNATGSTTECRYTCDTDYIYENGACINRKYVQCDENNDNPSNSTDIIAQVEIAYTTVGGWEPAADCLWECNDTYFRDDGSAEKCLQSKEVACYLGDGSPEDKILYLFSQPETTLTYTCNEQGACKWVDTKGIEQNIAYQTNTTTAIWPVMSDCGCLPHTRLSTAKKPFTLCIPQEAIDFDDRELAICLGDAVEWGDTTFGYVATNDPAYDQKWYLTSDDVFAETMLECSYYSGREYLLPNENETTPAPITALRGIEQLPVLDELYLDNNRIEDITPLARIGNTGYEGVNFDAIACDACNNEGAFLTDPQTDGTCIIPQQQPSAQCSQVYGVCGNYNGVIVTSWSHVEVSEGVCESIATEYVVCAPEITCDNPPCYADLTVQVVENRESEETETEMPTAWEKAYRSEIAAACESKHGLRVLVGHETGIIENSAPMLTTLHLPNNQLNHDELVPIGGLTALEYLNLSSNVGLDIDFGGVGTMPSNKPDYLRTLTKMKMLNLSGDGFESDDLVELADMADLQWLYLADNNIATLFIDVIPELKKDDCSCEEVEISGYTICRPASNETNCGCAIEESVCSGKKYGLLFPLFSSLELLDLRNNPLDADYADTFAPVDKTRLGDLTALRTLDIGRDTAVATQSDEIKAIMNDMIHLPSIKTLIAENRAISDIGTLGIVTVTDDEGKTFEDFSRIEDMDLSGNDISSVFTGTGTSALDIISRMYRLRFLALDHNAEQIGDLSFAKDLDALEYLSMMGAGLTDISQAVNLPNLTRLDASGNYIRSLENLATHRSLAFALLSDNCIDVINDPSWSVLFDRAIIKDGDEEQKDPEDCATAVCPEGSVCTGGTVMACDEIDSDLYDGGYAFCYWDCSGWNLANCEPVAVPDDEDEEVTDVDPASGETGEDADPIRGVKSCELLSSPSGKTYCDCPAYYHAVYENANSSTWYCAVNSDLQGAAEAISDEELEAYGCETEQDKHPTVDRCLDEVFQNSLCGRVQRTRACKDVIAEGVDTTRKEVIESGEVPVTDNTVEKLIGYYNTKAHKGMKVRGAGLQPTIKMPVPVHINIPDHSTYVGFMNNAQGVLYNYVRPILLKYPDEPLARQHLFRDDAEAGEEMANVLGSPMKVIELGCKEHGCDDIPIDGPTTTTNWNGQTYTYTPQLYTGINQNVYLGNINVEDTRDELLTITPTGAPNIMLDLFNPALDAIWKRRGLPGSVDDLAVLGPNSSVRSCEQYVYQKYFDFSRYHDYAAALGDKPHLLLESVFDDASMLSLFREGAVGGISVDTLEERLGNYPNGGCHTLFGSNATCSYVRGSATIPMPDPDYFLARRPLNIFAEVLHLADKSHLFEGNPNRITNGITLNDPDLQSVVNVSSTHGAWNYEDTFESWNTLYGKIATVKSDPQDYSALLTRIEIVNEYRDRLLTLLKQRANLELRWNKKRDHARRIGATAYYDVAPIQESATTILRNMYQYVSADNILRIEDITDSDIVESFWKKDSTLCYQSAILKGRAREVERKQVDLLDSIMASAFNETEEARLLWGPYHWGRDGYLLDPNKPDGYPRGDTEELIETVLEQIDANISDVLSFMNGDAFVYGDNSYEINCFDVDVAPECDFDLRDFLERMKGFLPPAVMENDFQHCVAATGNENGQFLYEEDKPTLFEYPMFTVFQVNWLEVYDALAGASKLPDDLVELNYQGFRKYEFNYDSFYSTVKDFAKPGMISYVNANVLASRSMVDGRSLCEMQENGSGVWDCYSDHVPLVFTGSNYLSLNVGIIQPNAPDSVDKSDQVDNITVLIEFTPNLGSNVKQTFLSKDMNNGHNQFLLDFDNGEYRVGINDGYVTSTVQTWQTGVAQTLILSVSNPSEGSTDAPSTITLLRKVGEQGSFEKVIDRVILNKRLSDQIQDSSTHAGQTNGWNVGVNRTDYDSFEFFFEGEMSRVGIFKKAFPILTANGALNKSIITYLDRDTETKNGLKYALDKQYLAQIQTLLDCYDNIAKCNTVPTEWQAGIAPAHFGVNLGSFEQEEGGTTVYKVNGIEQSYSNELSGAYSGSWASMFKEETACDITSISVSSKINFTRNWRCFDQFPALLDTWKTENAVIKNRIDDVARMQKDRQQQLAVALLDRIMSFAPSNIGDTVEDPVTKKKKKRDAIYKFFSDYQKDGNSMVKVDYSYIAGVGLYKLALDWNELNPIPDLQKMEPLFAQILAELINVIIESGREAHIFNSEQWENIESIQEEVKKVIDLAASAHIKVDYSTIFNTLLKALKEIPQCMIDPAQIAKQYNAEGVTCEAGSTTPYCKALQAVSFARALYNVVEKLVNVFKDFNPDTMKSTLAGALPDVKPETFLAKMAEDILMRSLKQTMYDYDLDFQIADTMMYNAEFGTTPFSTSEFTTKVPLEEIKSAVMNDVARIKSFVDLSGKKAATAAGEAGGEATQAVKGNIEKIKDLVDAIKGMGAIADAGKIDVAEIIRGIVCTGGIGTDECDKKVLDEIKNTILSSLTKDFLLDFLDLNLQVSVKYHIGDAEDTTYVLTDVRKQLENIIAQNQEVLSEIKELVRVPQQPNLPNGGSIYKVMFDAVDANSLSQMYTSADSLIKDFSVPNIINFANSVSVPKWETLDIEGSTLLIKTAIENNFLNATSIENKLIELQKQILLQKLNIPQADLPNLAVTINIQFKADVDPQMKLQLPTLNISAVQKGLMDLYTAKFDEIKQQLGDTVNTVMSLIGEAEGSTGLFDGLDALTEGSLNEEAIKTIFNSVIDYDSFETPKAINKILTGLDPSLLNLPTVWTPEDLANLDLSTLEANEKQLLIVKHPEKFILTLLTHTGENLKPYLPATDQFDAEKLFKQVFSVYIAAAQDALNLQVPTELFSGSFDPKEFAMMGLAVLSTCTDAKAREAFDALQEEINSQLEGSNIVDIYEAVDPILQIFMDLSGLIADPDGASKIDAFVVELEKRTPKLVEKFGDAIVNRIVEIIMQKLMKLPYGEIVLHVRGGASFFGEYYEMYETTNYITTRFPETVETGENCVQGMVTPGEQNPACRYVRFDGANKKAVDKFFKLNPEKNIQQFEPYQKYFVREIETSLADAVADKVMEEVADKLGAEEWLAAIGDVEKYGEYLSDISRGDTQALEEKLKEDYADEYAQIEAELKKYVNKAKRKLEELRQEMKKYAQEQQSMGQEEAEQQEPAGGQEEHFPLINKSWGEAYSFSVCFIPIMIEWGVTLKAGVYLKYGYNYGMVENTLTDGSQVTGATAYAGANPYLMVDGFIAAGLGLDLEFMQVLVGIEGEIIFIDAVAPFNAQILLTPEFLEDGDIAAKLYLGATLKPRMKVLDAKLNLTVGAKIKGLGEYVYDYTIADFDPLIDRDFGNVLPIPYLDLNLFSLSQIMNAVK